MPRPEQPLSELNKHIVALWNAGLTTIEIARVVGRSRNAVAGAVWRARQRGEQVEVRGAPANIAAAKRDSSATAEAARKPHQNPTTSPPKSHYWPALEAPRLSDDPHEPIGCRWIEGDPGEDWAYCQRRALPLRSWCAAHRARVYKPLPQATTRTASSTCREAQP